MKPSVLSLIACVAAGACIATGCTRRGDQEAVAPLPNIPTIVPPASAVTSLVALAAPPASAASTGTGAGGAAASSPAAHAPSAEMSKSPSTGPANGSTAVGGVTAGQGQAAPKSR